MGEDQVQVLIIDDDEDDWLLTRALLADAEGVPFAAEWADGYEVGLAALQRGVYDVCLLDYRLGARDGLELLREGLASGCRTPIILLTGQGSRALDAEAMRSGAADYLPKGHLTVTLLERAIRHALERACADERIREQAALLDAATEAIYACDLEGRVLFWNRGAEQLYGWVAAAATGRLYRELLGPGSPACAGSVAREHLLREGRWQAELPRLVYGSGATLTVESRWTLVRGADGRPRSLLAVDTDITEKKLLEAQFLRAQRLESIGTLAGGIAHDLNNVLTPIVAAAPLLRRGLCADDEERLLGIIERNARRGADLVRQILAFARGAESRRLPVQARHLVWEVQQIVRETFPRSIAVSVDLPNDLWLMQADATQLHQVLMNLCVNARDAMPAGGTLTLSAHNLWIDEHFVRMRPGTAVGPYVVLTVQDTGTGIPPALVDRVFEPFFTTKEIGVGTGLGLSTVAGIVKGHEGFIDVVTGVGEGTCFRIFLPAAEQAMPPEAPPSQPPTGHGEWVLLADDEAAIRETARTLLEHHGYRVLTACDGVDAVAQFANHDEPIQVAIVDMAMPNMDGQTTIRTLQKLHPELRFIATSGLGTNERLARSACTGLASFLHKPYGGHELLRALHLALEL